MAILRAWLFLLEILEFWTSPAGLLGTGSLVWVWLVRSGHGLVLNQTGLISLEILLVSLMLMVMFPATDR